LRDIISYLFERDNRKRLSPKRWTFKRQQVEKSTNKVS